MTVNHMNILFCNFVAREKLSVPSNCMTREILFNFHGRFDLIQVPRAIQCQIRFLVASIQVAKRLLSMLSFIKMFYSLIVSMRVHNSSLLLIYWMISGYHDVLDVIILQIIIYEICNTHNYTIASKVRRDIISNYYK